ncbi:MAG: glycosyltransferase family 8 protein, partial [Planctomycetia bacterium]
MSPAGLDVLHVASGAEVGYALPMAVAIGSVAAHLAPDRRAVFHLLDAGLGSELRERVVTGLDPARFTVEWVTPDRSGYVGLPLWGRMSVATYDKLSLADVLDPGVKRILWIDADTLVRTDVSVLWDQSMSGAAALAAPDELVPQVGAAFGVAGWLGLGLDPGLPYFNAVVLLADLDLWRKASVRKEALEYLHRHARQTYFWDQEGLNAALAGRWAALGRRWNCSPVEAAGVEPSLLHFHGNLKPWRRLGDSRWHREYYAALERTAWKGWRPGVSV